MGPGGPHGHPPRLPCYGSVEEGLTWSGEQPANVHSRGIPPLGLDAPHASVPMASFGGRRARWPQALPRRRDMGAEARRPGPGPPRLGQGLTHSTAPRAPTHCDALAGRQCRAGPRDYARTPCCVPWGCTARQACPCPPRSWASQTRGQDSSRECGRSREPREPARGLQVCAVCGGRAYELPSLRPAQRSALCSRQPDHLPPHSPPLHRGLCAQGGPRPQTGQSFAAMFVPGGVSSRQNPGGHPGGEAVRRSVGRLSKLLLLL